MRSAPNSFVERWAATALAFNQKRKSDLEITNQKGYRFATNFDRRRVMIGTVKHILWVNH
jgi:hypothetical protein